MKILRQEAKFELRPEGGVGVSLVVNGEVQCGYRNGLYGRFWSSGMLSVVKGDTDLCRWSGVRQSDYLGRAETSGLYSKGDGMMLESLVPWLLLLLQRCLCLVSCLSVLRELGWE